MRRRKFLRTAGVGGATMAAAGTLAAPAIAQSMPEVKWRMASSFPKSLDAIYGAGEFFTKRVAALTDNKFQIRSFAAGEIVPALQVVDAVQNETVECGHTGAYYYVGKDPTFAFDTALPFGLNTRQHNAWVYHGGGLELMREFYKDYKMTSFLVGHTGAQMGGWFRKEIKTLDDLKGLKFRVGGFAGQVLAKLGVVPQQIAAGDIYPALEKGTIDAAEWVGPYDDLKLGFYKVAPYYYYPGWWEGSTAISLYCGDKAFEALPAAYKEAISVAAGDTVGWSLAKYDAQNPRALRELIAGGAKVLPFSQAMMEAAFNAANEIYAETSAKNPKFRKVYESWKPFRAEEVLWFRVVENTFDNFMARQSAAGKL
ncbi:TRAP transporter substrate-binding protein [Reyranella massiliensis]|uniref:TRAP transporter substrate-binding protein n=1 Tax=Reyranella massiliensis TaxID=445220 RepID=UPI00030B3F69|nr:TRAP transporter substrate-binding protein [Reyranella massiliensis]